MAPKTFIAIQSGNTEIEGVQVVFHRALTRVPEGHPILTQHPDFFKEDEPVLLGVPEPTPAPQAPEPAADPPPNDPPTDVAAALEVFADAGADAAQVADVLTGAATDETSADGKPVIPADKPAAFSDVKALAESYGIDLTNDKNQARSGAKLWDDLVAIRDGESA